MQRILFVIIFLMIYSLVFAQEKYQFSYANPESKGFSSEKLALLEKHLIESGSSSMLILKDGKIIFEWGKTDQKHLIHSIRKSILNSLYGIAIANGEIDTSMTLAELNFNDIEPVLTEKEQEARIADLLKSRSGVYHNSAAVNNAMIKDKPERGRYKAGEHYYYNNWDFNALGAILEQSTERDIYTMFMEEIALPLGMIDYNGNYDSINMAGNEYHIAELDGFYQYEENQSKYPAFHFRMSARDLALYGMLYLNYGEWNGDQIIPKDWIDVSTKAYSIYDPKYGSAYGMLWRVRVPNENTKRNSFYHTGLGIHMLGIYPDSNMVIVHRVDTESDFEYNEGDFYKMLSLTFGARE